MASPKYSFLEKAKDFISSKYNVAMTATKVMFTGGLVALTMGCETIQSPTVLPNAWDYTHLGGSLIGATGKLSGKQGAALGAVNNFTGNLGQTGRDIAVARAGQQPAPQVNVNVNGYNPSQKTYSSSPMPDEEGSEEIIIIGKTRVRYNLRNYRISGMLGGPREADMIVGQPLPERYRPVMKIKEDSQSNVNETALIFRPIINLYPSANQSSENKIVICNSIEDRDKDGKIDISKECSGVKELFNLEEEITISADIKKYQDPTLEFRIVALNQDVDNPLFKYSTKIDKNFLTSYNFKPGNFSAGTYRLLFITYANGLIDTVQNEIIQVRENLESAPKEPASKEIAPKKISDENIADKLEKLKELKEKGLITEEEYNQKRKTLVDKL